MLKGTISIGIIQAYIQYITLAAEPLTEVSYILNSLQSALASAERTFAFIDEMEEISDADNNKKIDKVNGEVIFDHVIFGYKKNKILMRDVSFIAKPGQKIAIVGATGVGNISYQNSDGVYILPITALKD